LKDITMFRSLSAGATAAFFTATFLLSLQGPVFADSHAMVLPVDPAPLVAETSEGDRRLTIEVADEEHERSAGLMFRQTMADDHGMLFVFDQTRPAGFWMKNTPMPLDLVFIGEDGRVRSIEKGEPFSEASISPGVPVRFVLEVKRGIAQAIGLEEGDRIRHPLIDAVAGD
jgi:uncharacterized membrane protein (UPF0127 family)